MSDVTVKRVEDLEYYNGEKRADDMQFRFAGKELGVTACSMNVIDMEPRSPNFPEHDDHEEVYVVLRGSAMLHVGNQHHELVPGVLARVGAGEKRMIEPGPEGATVLAIGAKPSKAYPAPTPSKPKPS
jgi:quercetin dioxygenase-like cupin family protein